MNPKLLQQIINGRWLIQPEAVIGFLPYIAAAVEGRELPRMGDWAEQRAQHRPVMFTIDAGGQVAAASHTASRAPGVKNIAIIPIAGPLVKYDEACGPVGTATLTDYVKNADSNPEVDAIVLKIDSPGGMVDGTQTLAHAIRDTRKPVVAFVDDGVMASAAYWIGSAADEIIASQKTDVIGSIGVMVSFADVRPAYEKLGVKFHELYSSLSPDKNKIFNDALAGQYDGIIKNMLDPIAKEFHSEVKKYRKEKLQLQEENVLTGKTYMASDAVKNGLIDAIGNFDFAIKRAAKLSSEQAAITNLNKSSSTMKIKTAWTAIMSFLGIAAESELTDAHIEKMNAELQTLSGVKERTSALEQQIIAAGKELNPEAKEGDKVDLVASIKKLKEEKAEAERLRDEYGRKAGAISTEPVKDGADKNDKKTGDAEADHFARVGAYTADALKRHGV